MKKLKFSLVALFIAFYIFAYNQTVKTEWSNKIEVTKKIYPLNLVTKIDDKYIFKSREFTSMGKVLNDYYEIYDNNGKLIKRNVIEVKIDNNTLDINYSQNLEDKILIVASYVENGKKYIYTNYIDYSAKYLNDWKQIDIIDKEGRKDELNIKYFYLKSNKKLYSFKADYIKDNEKIKYSVNAYDENFEKLFKKKIILPYTENLFKNPSFFIDNDERCYITGTFDRKKPKKSNKSDDASSNTNKIDVQTNGVEVNNTDSDDEALNSKIYIQRFVPTLLTFSFSYPETIDVNELNIDLNGNLITQLNYTKLKNDRLLIVGFYNNGTDTVSPLKANGVFTGFFDLKEPAKPIINLQKFDEAFLKRMCKTDEEIDLKKGIPHLNLKDIFVFEDGSFIISGDDFHSVYNQDYQGNLHYSNDIYNIKFKPDGFAEWFSYIPKYQKILKHNLFIGHKSIQTKNKIYFLFNDNVKNYPESQEYDLYLKILSTKKGNKSKVNTSAVKSTNLSENNLETVDTFDPKSYENIMVIASVDINGNISKEILPGVGTSTRYNQIDLEEKNIQNKLSPEEAFEEDRLYKVYFAYNSLKYGNNELIYMSTNNGALGFVKDFRFFSIKFD